MRQYHEIVEDGSNNTNTIHDLATYLYLHPNKVLLDLYTEYDSFKTYFEDSNFDDRVFNLPLKEILNREYENIILDSINGVEKAKERLALELSGTKPGLSILTARVVTNAIRRLILSARYLDKSVAGVNLLTTNYKELEKLFTVFYNGDNSLRCVFTGNNKAVQSLESICAATNMPIYQVVQLLNSCYNADNGNLVQDTHTHVKLITNTEDRLVIAPLVCNLNKSLTIASAIIVATIATVWWLVL